MANYNDPGPSTRSNIARKNLQAGRISSVRRSVHFEDEVSHGNAGRQICPECKETFNGSDFVEHLYTHLSNGNNSNEDIGNETLDELQKKKENYTESDCDILFLCNICNELCKTEYEKKMHRNKMHPLYMNKKNFVKKVVYINNKTQSQQEKVTEKSRSAAAPAKVQRRRMTYQENPVIDKTFKAAKIQRRRSTTTKAPEERPSISELSDYRGILLSDSDQSADEEVPNDPVRPVPQKNLPETRTQTLNSTQQRNTTQSQQEEVTRKRKSESAAVPAKVQRRRMTYQEKPVIDKRIKSAKIQRRRSTTTKAPEERTYISEPSDSDQSADEEIPDVPVKYTLYKCHCSHHFMTTETFTEHFKICKPNTTVSTNSRECAGCGQRFFENELENHNKNRCNEIPEFEIIKMAIQNIQNSKYKPKSKKINTTKNLNKEKHTERVSNEATSTGGKPKLYQCTNCSATFLVQSALKTHISLELHDALVKLKCNTCKLIFGGSNVLNKHRKEHHSRMNLHNSTDFEILCYLNNNIHSALVPLSSQNVHLGNEAPERNDNQRKIIILYKCKICDIHYTMESSIRRHLQLYKNKVHDVKGTTICRICDLKFTVASLRDHNNEVHHSGSNMEHYFHIIEYPMENTVAGSNQNGHERRGVNDRLQENAFPTINVTLKMGDWHSLRRARGRK